MYKNTFFTNVFLLIITIFFHNSNAQTNIALWDFESFPGGFVNPSTSTGTGTASVIVQSAINSGTAFNALGTQGGNGNATGCGTTQSGAAWQIFPMDVGTFNESNGLEFKASTVGYENIFFKWDQRWSNTAPNTLRLQYTVDGSTWTNFAMTSGNTTYCLGTLNSNGTYEAATPGDSFRRFTVNLTAIIGAANNANFGIRLMASFNQTTFDYRQTTFDVPSTSYPISTNNGTWRFDNVSFSGSLFAGPSLATMSTSNATICNG
ncbi:MAG: hypothetical protein H7174_06745, partial [Flavobacterium sp.]|nr:hypothetical protein [Flavobacterium sp.]